MKPIDETLHQELLEFIYDLLDDDAAAQMQARITSDRDVAVAYATVKQQADRLGAAARLHGPPVLLSKPEDDAVAQLGESTSDGGEPAMPREVAAAAPADDLSAVVKWVFGLAAALMVAFIGWQYFRADSPLRVAAAPSATDAIAEEHLRLVVTGPDTFDPEIDTRISVATSTVDRQPLPAKVKYAIYQPDSNKPIYESDPQETGEDGRLLLAIPPHQFEQVKNPRLEITAERGDAKAAMSTFVEVDKIRYATQLTTDKPLYRPGETIRFRSLTLTRFGLTSDRELPVRFSILDPGGGTVPGSEFTGYTNRGVASGQFTVPPHLPGGAYILRAESAAADEPDFPPEEREVAVRKYRLPRLKKLLEFTRDSYAPGDHVVADFSADRAEGGPAGEARLFVSAMVDGETVFQAQAKSAADGTHRVEFDLPKEIEAGQGTLAVIVDDGGNRETIAETIPINLGRVAMKFYPEGGDLIAGLENRVYFYAHDPIGDPIHIELARVIDSKGKEVARLSTYHEGRGRFRFTPAAGEKYRVEVVEPADVRLDGSLPAIKDTGIVMNTGNGVFAAGKPLQFDILSAKKERPLVVTAVCRGTQVVQQEFVTSEVRSISDDAKSGSRLSLDLPPQAGGVIRVTVYDYGVSPPRPIAERLVYRRPQQKLNVAISTPQAKYAPGEQVQLALRVTDEHGSPRAAALGLSVVDDAMLSLADDRSPTMPTYYFLASEIESPEDLEDANFYLLEERTKDKSPAKALDLLLGTQGWRRFAQLGEADNSREPTAREVDEAIDPDKVADAPNAINAETDAQAEADKAEALATLVAMEGTTDLPTLHDNLAEVHPKYNEAVAAFHESRRGAVIWAGQIAFLGGLVLLVALAVVGVLRLIRETWFWMGTACAVGLCLIVGGLWMTAEVDSTGQVTLVSFTQHKRQVAMFADEDDDADYETANSRCVEICVADGGAEGAAPVPSPDEPADSPVLDAVALDDDNDDPFGGDDGAEADLGGADPFGAEPEAPAAAAPLPQNEPVPADFADGIPADPFFADGDVMFDEELDLGGERFLPLGEVGEALVNELQGIGNNQDGGFFYIPGPGGDGEWRHGYTGTVHDVALIRQQWLAANKSGNEKASLAFAKAYTALLERYQLPVRQYAHVSPPKPPPADGLVVRTDFTETLAWHPLLITDNRGNATMEFQLSDAVTTFRVRADAHGAGRIGAVDGEVISRIPFSLEPKLPLVVTAGDRIDLPLAINNDTLDKLPVAISFNTDGGLLSLDGKDNRELTVDAGQRTRETFTLNVTGEKGEAALTFTGTAGSLQDGIAKTIEVVPSGFPVSQSYSGRIEGDQEVTITLPDDWVAGSLEITLAAFPSTLADLQAGMAGMLRDPNGCFEQTSSSNYPNVLALSYMEEHDVADPNFTRRAKELLDKGYAKLISFECKDDGQEKGFEWFGQWPAHEALTAYGLMEFRDMQEVWDVDQAMIDRTAKWLLDRRDGEGGFQRNSRALDSFGAAPDDVTNAYIVWALTEAEQDGIDEELDHSIATAKESEDPYLLALAAASALNAGREDAGQELLKLLAEHQQDDGHLAAKNTTITRSGGESLKIETTALAAMAWLKDAGSAEQANQAIEWIVGARQGSGGFGNTQATILALRALIEHSKANRQTTTDGELVVMRDGKEIGRQPFTAGETGTITLDGLAAKLQPGENELTITLTGDNQMPYALDVSYRTKQPVSDEGCPVRLQVALGETDVEAGATVPVDVSLENISGEGQPMTVAVVGLPAGLEARVEHLDELKEAGEFDYYELRGREVVFYWRSLAPAAKDDEALGFSFDTVAEIPGQYTGPASRAYLYYTAELKHWVEPLAIEIAK